MADWKGKIREIAGGDSIRDPAPSPWTEAGPSLEVAPGGAEAIDAILSLAAEEGLGVIPRGGGTRLAWGNPPRRAEVILSLERMNRIVACEPGDLTVTVEAGLPFDELARELRSKGLHLALPWWRREGGTVGGWIASGEESLDHGPPSDLILGMRTVLPAGGPVWSGSRVVKNVAGFDLHKTLVGSFGTLGVVTEVTLRLRPLPGEALLLSVPLGPEVEALRDLTGDLERSELRPTFRMVTRPPGGEAGGGLVLEILLQGDEAEVEAQGRRALEILSAGGARVDSTRLGKEGYRSIPEDPFGIGAKGGSDAFPCRVGLAPSGLLDFLRAERDLVLRGHLESGLLRVRVPQDGNDPPGVQVDRLRRTARGMGGTLVVEGPGGDGVDVWGPPPDDFFLMEAIKREFDPKGVLSPGRYIGGL